MRKIEKVNHVINSSNDMERNPHMIQLLGICFFSGVPEDVVEEIGGGEKGGWLAGHLRPLTALRAKRIRQRGATPILVSSTRLLFLIHPVSYS